MYLINRATMFGTMLALLVLTATAGAVYAAPDVPNPVVHVVQPGDNLGRLSERYGISIGALALANGLSSSVIHVGQHLVIPGSDWAVNPESKGRDPHQAITYVVRRGDYLGRVAREYDTTVEAIMNASSLASPLIITDQFLTIPAISGPASEDEAETVVDAAAAEKVDDSTEVGEEVSDANAAEAVVDAAAAETVDDSAEVGVEVSEVEARMRQELHNAHYPYAFTESPD